MTAPPRIAVIGAGYFAQFHLEGWRDAGAQVVALCDVDQARADALASRFAVPQRFSDAARMLDLVRPDLADVVLPPQAQLPVVRAALQRRVPTVCQKPFGDDLAQAEEMTAFSTAQRTPLVVHENFRFTPWFRECRRLIDTGFFGRVHGIGFRLRPGDGQGPRAYLDRQPYFQTMPQLLVRETAVHFIDTFRYLMGEVVAVTARLRRLNPVIAGEDAALIVFEFDDDRAGLFDGNRLNDHVAANLRLTMGEMWLEGEHGVLQAGRRRPAVVEAAPRRRARTPLRTRRQRRLRRRLHRAAVSRARAPSRRRAAGERRARLPGEPACAGRRLPLSCQRPQGADGRFRPSPALTKETAMKKICAIAATAAAVLDFTVSSTGR